jgi:hypothetical protein
MNVGLRRESFETQVQFFNSESAQDIFCMAKSTPEVTSRVGRNPGRHGGYLIYRASVDAWPLEDDIIVQLESEAAAYQYLVMLKATLIPEL